MGPTHTMHTARDGFIKFFQFFDNNRIEYCVVGQHDCIPDNIMGDVDIVIQGSELHKIASYLIDFCSENRVLLVQHLQHEHTAHCFVVSLGDSNGPEFLNIDICSDYLRNGRLFLSASEILEGCVPALDGNGAKKGFDVAAPPLEFAYYLLKKIDKQFLDDEQGRHLSSVWKMAPDAALTRIERFWSGRDVALLRKAAEDNDWTSVREALPGLQRSLHDNLPRTTITAFWQEFARKVRRVLHPTGLFVAFLGADGSGKTTVIKHTSAALAPAFRRSCIIHLRPFVGLNRGDGKPVVDPHGKPPRSSVVSVVKVFYLLFDYAVGWWAIVRPQLVRSTLVIFDRYYHDLLVDPKRFRYGGPMWLVRWLGKLIPQPDLWILLDAPADVLQARKQEVPFEETARQREAYLKLVEGMKNGVVVDASQNLDEVVSDVNAAILGVMAERTSRRLG